MPRADANDSLRYFPSFGTFRKKKKKAIVK